MMSPIVSEVKNNVKFVPASGSLHFLGKSFHAMTKIFVEKKCRVLQMTFKEV